MTEVLKRHRTTALQKFTRNYNILDKLLGSKTAISEINFTLDDLSKAWVIVEEKHDEYVNALTEDDATSEEWISKVQTEYNRARQRVSALRHQVERDQACATAELLYNSQHAMIKDMRKNIEELISQNFLPETLVHERTLLASLFEKFSETHSNYLSASPDEVIVNKLLIEMSQNVERFNHTKLLIDNYILKYKTEMTKKRTLCLEKMPLPKFDGFIRNYPQFKKDFDKLVLPHIDAKESAFTLRQCLPPEVRNQLACCDDDVTEMLKRLDLKYGDPSKIMESIVSQIHKYKKLETDEPKKIIQFVDLLEKAYRDLKSLELESEIANANIVSIIENKLPKSLQMEWYREIYKENSIVRKTAKFPSLLKFLTTERDALEYATSDLHRGRSLDSSNACTITSVSKSPCIIHFWSENHSTPDCRTFINLTLENKLKVLEEKSACYGCLEVGHRANQCKNKTPCKNGCNASHHPSLHRDKVTGDSFTVLDESKTGHTNVLLPIMKVVPDSNRCKTLSCLWDAGADISFITNSKAKLMKLKGNPVTLHVTTAGGTKSVIETMAYDLKIFDTNYNTHHLNVFGMEKITGPIAGINMELIMQQFGDVVTDEITRPSGNVDILIGYDYAGWHPTPEKISQHLVILKNIFGSCIGGRFPTGNENTEKCSLTVSRVNYVQMDAPLDQFMIIESMGVDCNPRCGNCRCGTCPIGGKPYSLKEERELKMIEGNLEFKGTHWITGYPWIKDPKLLPPNYNYALKRLESTERRLERDSNFQSVYIDQIEDMIKRGVARMLSQEEIKTYSGPIHYIAHSAVIKPDSKSTPLRIVFDSRSLNSYLAKGPDAYMNNQLAVFLKFRENEIAIVGDIRKMYNSVFIKVLEQHTHRFLWRNMETHRVPDNYVITAVNMGDRPSGTIATVALHKTANKGKETYPKAAEIILKSTYVDDIVDSVSSTQEAYAITEDISNLLKPGNFHIKGWTISGENRPMIHLGDTNVQKVLGVSWEPEMDTINFDVNLTFSKYNKAQFDPYLNENNVPSLLSKRIVMSQLNGIYDPLGLLVPFTIKGKLLLRNLWAQGLDWDTPLPTQEYEKWVNFFKEMQIIPSLKFPRSFKPNNTSTRLPTLITFSDASKEAFGCCSYIRWELNDGAYESRLVVSKSRVAPLKTTTIVRLELSAAVLAKRLRLFIEESLRLKFERVIHIIDSQIVKAMINKDSYGFNTFVATRVGEIQAATNPSEWHWLESNMNIADIISRGATIDELGIHSDWQSGPKFLKRPVEEWNIRDDVTLPEELPERSKYAFPTIGQLKQEIIIKIDRFSNYTRLIHVTARILKLKTRRTKDGKHSLLNLKSPLLPHHLDDAKSFWEKKAQSQIQMELQRGLAGKGSFRKLNVKQVNGVFVASGRIEAWEESIYNKNKRAIIPGAHRYTELYARNLHNIAHLGVNADIAKIRSEYWIIGVKKLVNMIRYNCVTCRKRDGKLQQQVMAPLPIERLKPAPVWHNSGIDLFGPFFIKGEVNKRTQGKGYAVIFTCLLTRAVFIDIATDYSTDAFLLVFRRFVSLRGYPAIIYSDPGSQLTSASKELNEMFRAFDWDKINNTSAQNGLEWKFSPANAPWYNGCCEALIRSVKKSIFHAIGDQIVTYTELQTILFESANIVNARPIGITPTTVEDGSYLSPNDMLLGRSSNKVPAGEFELTTNSKRRLYFVQRIVDAFWKKWITNYFPSLLERPKWHHAKRDMKVGDVVIIQDKDLRRSQWKLGILTEVFRGIDSKVRRVKVKYVNSSSDSPKVVERPVQQLVIILAAEENTIVEDTTGSGNTTTYDSSYSS